MTIIYNLTSSTTIDELITSKLCTDRWYVLFCHQQNVINGGRGHNYPIFPTHPPSSQKTTRSAGLLASKHMYVLNVKNNC